MARESAYHVVGLISRHLDHRYAVCTDYILYIWHRACDILRLLFALRLVGLIHLMAESRARRIKTHRNMRWILLFQDLVESIDKAEYSRCVHPLRCNAGSSYKSIVCTIYQGVSVEEKQFFVGHILRYLRLSIHYLTIKV